VRGARRGGVACATRLRAVFPAGAERVPRAPPRERVSPRPCLPAPCCAPPRPADRGAERGGERTGSRRSWKATRTRGTGRAGRSRRAARAPCAGASGVPRGAGARWRRTALRVMRWRSRGSSAHATRAWRARSLAFIQARHTPRHPHTFQHKRSERSAAGPRGGIATQEVPSPQRTACSCTPTRGGYCWL
jgi:hypothetical protein